MPVFVTSTSAATRHGVYAIDRKPPSVVQATGTATTGFVGAFKWGPDQELVQIEDPADFIDRFAPFGSDHTATDTLTVMSLAWPVLKVVRVVGSTAAKATATLQKVGPTACVVLTAKYKGTLGNSLVATVSAPTDGDANHFNLTVTLTGASGTTTDFIENLNYSGTGADSTPDLTGCKLIGSISKSASGVPTYGNTLFSTGSNGTLASGDWVGTAGTANKGIALFESDDSIDGVCVGDPGNTDRAAVNAGLLAHADLMTDRVAYLNGDSAQNASGAQTDVEDYRSLRVVYVDVWAYVKDTIDGTERLLPPGAFAASVAAQLSPSTSIAWKSSAVSAMLSKISRLEAARSSTAYTNEKAGIVTLIRKSKGGFAFECGVVTYAPLDPSRKLLTRTRMGHFIARSYKDSIQESVDSPNVPLNQQDEVNALQVFLDGLVRAKDRDPNNEPHIVSYVIEDLKAANPQSQIDSGIFVVPATVKTSAAQEKIFLSLSYGPSVNVVTGL